MTTTPLADAALALAAFAATNLDDALLLAALFSDPRKPRAGIVLGQFLGIALLTAASLAAALAATAIAGPWTRALGLLPLALGLASLASRERPTPESASHQHGTHTTQPPTAASRAGLWRTAAAVAAITIANGSDNLALYVPLFADTLTRPFATTITLATFAAMTALWCLLGWLAVAHPRAATLAQRTLPPLLPWILIVLGLAILGDA